MCIFALPVSSVSNTKILVAAVPGGRQQLTVYENKVHCIGRNAMILPVPIGSEGSFGGSEVQLIDMSKYPGDIFKDCEDMFPKHIGGGGFGSAGGFSFGGTKGTLAVVRSGGYLCSIVPSVEDMKRINSTVFTLPSAIEELLRTNYGTGFSFIVCLFDRPLDKIHPIAYLHSMLPNGTMFIPTRHEHGMQSTHGVPLVGGNIFPQGNEFGGFNDYPVHPVPTVQHHAYCDICKSNPIIGSRYKCLHCDNFDLCSNCKTGHNPNHVLAKLDKSTSGKLWEGALLKERVYTNSTQQVVTTTADYDHIIYIYNGVCLQSIGDFTSIEDAPFRTQNRISWMCLALPEVPNLKRIQKMVIKGDFRNRDYTAAVVQ